ncbi:MAG: NUDIX hydrolase N-terminal domain-containing protein [Chloroflexi bacterium]|nr:NUDIX hydrolase N-terminal domain-containing protein [Chloroflexota bacterium]MBI3732446.1 NUDIX hydrolase N-terminal domain-containing protein [Chloroflexota bacterium]
MTPAQQIALWADKLRDMSAMGLLFSQNIYDRENYQTIQQMGMEMLALATGESLEQIEPLRAPVFSRPTPISTADAAIIDDAGRIFLIHRADNQKWAMPGGAMAVGETPAEAAAREAFEETGMRCQPVAFVGVHDSRLCGSVTRHHLYHFLFLCQPLNGGQGAGAGLAPALAPSHALEVLDARWFAEDALPPDLDPGHVRRIPEAYRVWRGPSTGSGCGAYFDR